MKKILFLSVLSIFVFSGVFGAEGQSDESKNNQEQFKNELVKNNIDAEKEIIQTDKIDKKIIRKNRRDIIKNKKRIKKTLNNMLLVGGGLMVLGLILYLIVTQAAFIGIAVMVLGLVLLLYGVLKKFF